MSRRRRPRVARLTAEDLSILRQRTGPRAERNYKQCDTDDFEVAVLRMRAGGVVRSIAGRRA